MKCVRRQISTACGDDDCDDFFARNDANSIPLGDISKIKLANHRGQGKIS